MEIILKTQNYKTENEFTLDQIQPTNPVNNSRLKRLEGECKIKSIRPLQFDCLKTSLLILPIIASFVGLLLLKYFKSFRVAVFYKQSSFGEATHLFIESLDEQQDIEQISINKSDKFFFFKNLKYRLEGVEWLPVGYEFQQQFEELRGREYLQRGINPQVIAKRQGLYGKNEHKVEIPNYFQYLFDVMTKPFFLLQYVICIIFILQKLVLFTIMYVIFSLGTTTVNYLLLYVSFLKIKEIAEKEVYLQIIRNGVLIEIKNHDLVPGDIIVPSKNDEICCDSVLLQGEVFVNEASLTGESIPVGKFPARNLTQAVDEHHWLFEGSKILEARNALAVVVNVGYGTRKGRIIRKILNRVPIMPDFFKTALVFLVETCIIGVVIYFVTISPLLLVNGIPKIFAGFRFMDFIAWSFPPVFPIFFNLSYSFSLIRMKWRGITGTEPQKTLQSANIKTFCFDKTGTLTQKEVEVFEVIRFIDATHHQDITAQKHLPQHSLVLDIFAACHTVRCVESDLMGDEVDLAMFLFSQYKMTLPQRKDDTQVKFIVADSKGPKLEILRINQFESKFQNMSVLVRNVVTEQYFVFIKGAPQKIEQNSTVKLAQYEHIVSTLSLGGYRTIGFGLKQIQKQEVPKYLACGRDQFDTLKIQALGIVAFQNKLKHDARQTIERLIDSEVHPKMITGDNIFIAVETGFRCGILKPDEKVVLLEGKKQSKVRPRRFEGILLQKKGQQIMRSPITLSEETDYINQTEYAIAIDNDFLKMELQPVLTKQIKLFARISPENKALVVKKFKEEEQRLYQSQPKASRWFGNSKGKVGMCGDGANDLIAIREADVGIGISDSDASYGASFSITEMLQLEYIVRQSKCASQNIIDMILYFGTVSFLKIVTSCLTVTDIAYFSSNQTIYFNFAHSVFLAIFIPLSVPVDHPTKQKPLCNLFSLRNHLIYWTNVIIPTIGLVLGFIYFKTTDSYIPNPSPFVTLLGYPFYCTISTIVFLMHNLPDIINVFSIYSSDPFKCPFYKNIPLLVLFSLNIVAAIAFFFITPSLSGSLQLVPLKDNATGGVLGILGGSLVVSCVLTKIIKYSCDK